MVRCEIRPRENGAGYNILVEVRSVTEPARASQTIVDPTRYVSARDVEREVCKQAARLAVHIHDTRLDGLIDPDQCAREAPAALAAAALVFHQEELRRGM